MNIGDIVKNAIQLHSKDFAKKFNDNKERMCQTLGIEYTDNASQARKAMIRIARDIKRDYKKACKEYLNCNSNLVSVISKTPGNVLPIFEGIEVNEKDSLLSMAVPGHEYYYIFTYKLKDNGGKNGK